MQNMIQKYLLITSIALLFLTACEEEKPSNDLLKVHITNEPSTLNAINNNSNVGSIILDLTQKSLIRFDSRNGDVIPVLVENLPQISQDGLHYQFKLRNDIFWDNQTKVKTEDVEFSIKLMVCNLNGNPSKRANYSGFIKQFHKISDTEFDVVMKENSVLNRNVFNGIFILQKAFYDSLNILDYYSVQQLIENKFENDSILSTFFEKFNAVEFGKNPELLNGLGQYAVKDWVQDQFIVLERKNNWWGKNDTSVYQLAIPEKIIFVSVKDENAASLALQNQEIDVSFYLSGNKVKELKETNIFNQHFKVNFTNQFGFNYLAFNTKPEDKKRELLFNDIKVRKAFAKAVPIDDMIKIVTNNEATKMSSFLLEGQEGYFNELPIINQNFDDAIQLLTEAGWVDSDNNGILDKNINGKKLEFSFELLYPEGPGTKEMVILIQEALKKIKIDCKLQLLDIAQVYKKGREHDFDMLLGSFSGSSYFQNQGQIWHTKSWLNNGMNYSGFGNQFTDSIINLANTELNKVKRAEYLKTLQKEVYNYQPFVFLYSPKRRMIVNNRYSKPVFVADSPGIILNALKSSAE